MEKKGLGALLNTEDNRDIALATVARAIGVDTAKHPKKNITDISMLTVEDQRDKGTCVGQAEGKDAEFQNFIETGKVVQLSKRGLYKLCKMQDGLPNSEGTYPRIAAAIRVSTGVPRESLIKDDNRLPYAEYMDVEVTNDFKTSASEFRSKGYSFVTTLDELKTAIDLTKAFNATLFVGDFNNIPVKPTDKNGQYSGTHRIWIIGYEDVEEKKVTRTKVYFLNSWGIKWAKSKKSADKKLLEKGIGWFYWDEFAPLYFRDGIVYLDMPNEIIDYAKAQQYIFPRQLDRGMRGTDVMELQKRLAEEIAADGQPCFRYKVGGKVSFTTYFGVETEKAVQRYQAVNKIVSAGDPKSTGYGRVGAKTLASLNKKKVSTPEPEVELSIIQKPTPNFTKGRGSYKPEIIVIHVMDGTLTGTDAWFAQTASQVSSHYGIGKNGEVHQYVKEEDQAWHAGTVVRPDFKLYKKGVNPNRYTIGIEHEGKPLVDDVWPEAMKKASAKLIAEICERHSIPLDRDHIIGHYQIRASKPNCPALNKGIIDELIELAASLSSNASEEAPTQITMNNISSSALKIVLLFLIGLLGLVTAFSIVWDVTHSAFSDITQILLGSFTAAITLVLGYYFGSPNSNEDDNGGIAGRGK